MFCRRRERRLALRNQEVSRVARLHAHVVADAADVIDFFEQDDFHLISLIMSANATTRADRTN